MAITAPKWFLIVPLGAGTLLMWRKDLTLRRKERGACISCGYDLSRTPPGVVCPECGASGPKTPIRN